MANYTETMMNIPLILRTVRHLKPTQVVHQVINRLHKPAYEALQAPQHELLRLQTEPIDRYPSMAGEKMCFINMEHDFAGWNFVGNGTLWTYNQCYFDFINQPGVMPEVGCSWIDRFIADMPGVTWGMDPYPIALRGINWIKFFCRYPECATKEREDSLYSQYRLLMRKLEYHLLANHLLEDTFSLYVGACYFDDASMYEQATSLLLQELSEQTLSDGAHYEQSPMYHCILLDRLLDCINVGSIAPLKEYASRQLGWLKAICYRDGSFPLMGDAAQGIAPAPADLFAYAERLGIACKPARLAASGYRKLENERVEAVVDAGSIACTYQPGHTHADTLTYELRIDGEPVVCDTGISTYDKTPRRQYERSTAAHNCVSAGGKDSYEVWGGFRVGRRCQTLITAESEARIEAQHDGFGAPCKRIFTLLPDGLSIEDSYCGQAVSRIHLAPGIDPARVNIEGADSVEVTDSQISREYNRFLDTKTIEIRFTNQVKYSIR